MHNAYVVRKVLAKGRATSETQQGEIDRSVHTSLYHPAQLPLSPSHFGVATNYIVSPKKRRSSLLQKVGKSKIKKFRVKLRGVFKK